MPQLYSKISLRELLIRRRNLPSSGGGDGCGDLGKRDEAAIVGVVDGVRLGFLGRDDI